MKSYVEFVTSKDRQNQKKLRILKSLFESNGFKINDQSENKDDPYIFVFNPDNNLSFEGIRVYEIGGQLAYRVQKEAYTHPYGKAYALPVEEMFDELLSEGMSDEEMGKEIIESVVKEIKDFFEQSFRAEKATPVTDDQLGKVYARSTGSDYSNQVFDKR